MTLRLPIPVVALLGLQLAPACAKDEPLVGRWSLTQLDGAASPKGLTMTMEFDDDLGGDLDYSLEVYSMYKYDYHTTLRANADDAPTYIIDVLPGDDIPASKMRCELAGDTLTCTDLDDEGFGNPVFKRD